MYICIHVGARALLSRRLTVECKFREIGICTALCLNLYTSSQPPGKLCYKLRNANVGVQMCRSRDRNHINKQEGIHILCCFVAILKQLLEML